MAPPHPPDSWQHTIEMQSLLSPHGLESLQLGWHAGGWHFRGAPEQVPDSQSIEVVHMAPSVQNGEQSGTATQATCTLVTFMVPSVPAPPVTVHDSFGPLGSVVTVTA